MVTLDRGMGLLQATATNIIGMVGVGPFLTIPFMVTAMGGPHILYAWAFGAMLALCDGLVYAELGAALPGSGGPYVYLREAYRPFGLGRLMAFVFIFQMMLVAPLSIAGAAVGFADYLGFYWTSMGAVSHNLIAAGITIVVTALLYRDIRSIGRLAVVMLVLVLATVGWVIVAGLFSFSWAQAFDFPPEARQLDARLLRAMAAAGLLAMYNYGGYNNICNIGEEIRAPERTIPRAIVLSIVVVVVLYVVMSTVILGMVPWREAQQTRTIASVFIARTFADPAAGRGAAMVMTALILFVTASSLYAVILGYSRIPFAAARDGQFFRAFGRVHPTKHFPHVSLLTIGAVALPFCFFSLGQLVGWLIQVQILLQFVWQCASVMLLRRYRRDIAKPFKMWLYPLPALVSLAMWLYIFVSSPTAGIVFSVAFLAVAVAAYFMFQKKTAAPASEAAVES
jgi:amino acid transporter